jgi:ribonuclease M5
MKKIIKEVIVVEGRDDISAVKAAVDAEVLQVNGFAVRKKETVEKIKTANSKNGIIILTDPDFAGEKIRKFIQSHCPEAKHAYIRRIEGTKEGDVGVENANAQAILRALEKARCEVVDGNREEFTMEELMDLGFTGKEDSTKLRELLGANLGIGYSNAKQLLSKLNRYGITRDEFNEAVEKIKK